MSAVELFTYSGLSAEHAAHVGRFMRDLRAPEPGARVMTGELHFAYDGSGFTTDALFGFTGHLYAIEIVGVGVKVGRAFNPSKRIKQHADAAARYGRTIGACSISPAHIEYKQNENALHQLCRQAFAVRSGREYYEMHSPLSAARLWLDLPMTRVLLSEAMAAGASAARTESALVTALRGQGQVSA